MESDRLNVNTIEMFLSTCQAAIVHEISLKLNAN